MNVFHLLAMVSPLMIGLILPCVVSLGLQRGHGGRIMARNASVFMAVLFAVLLLFSMMYGTAVLAWIQLCAVLTAFSVLVMGLMQLALWVRIGPNVAQMATSSVVLLMMGTVFYFNPIIDAAALEDKQYWVNLAITMNPWITVGGSILGADPLHARWLYHFSHTGEFMFLYPKWTDVAGIYLATFLVLFMPRLGWWIWKRTSHDGPSVQQADPV